MNFFLGAQGQIQDTDRWESHFFHIRKNNITKEAMSSVMGAVWKLALQTAKSTQAPKNASCFN